MNAFSYLSHESLGFMTITANRVMSSCLRRKMREAGIDLTSEQWGVLVLLWNMNSLTQDELAQIACVDKSSMSRILSLMEDKGLIDRRVDPSSARRKIIRATARAHAVQQSSLAVARDVVARALSNVSEEDCATCLKVLGAVKKNLQENEK